MVRNLEAALKDDIGTLSWMSPETKKQAIAKLEAFLNKNGYPDKWRDYSALEIDRGPYVLNRVHACAFEVRRDLNKIGRPVDRMEWQMSPPTVNAYYNPQINEIVFPAGIMQPPFFDAEADDAFNYGGMGSVIGHEMTHGFDDGGSQFDSTGIWPTGGPTPTRKLSMRKPSALSISSIVLKLKRVYLKTASSWLVNPSPTWAGWS